MRRGSICARIGVTTALINVFAPLRRGGFAFVKPQRRDIAYDAARAAPCAIGAANGNHRRLDAALAARLGVAPKLRGLAQAFATKQHAVGVAEHA